MKLLCAISWAVFSATVLAADLPYRYAIERIKTETASGIISIPAGTRVLLVSEEGDMCKVKTEEGEFTVHKSMLTSDAKVGANLAVRDAISQTAIKAAGDQPETTMPPLPSDKAKRDQRRREIRDQITVLNVQIGQISRQITAVGAPGNSVDKRMSKDALRAQSQNLRAKIATLNDELTLLNAADR